MKKIRISESITQRDNSESFKRYLSEVSKIPVLTTDEEYEIAILANSGDKKALDLLIKHNLRFAISVAKQYVKKDIKLTDLVNEANYGLITAAKKFDPTKGFKFISYAVWWIRKSILTHITDDGRMIRIPSNQNNVLTKVRRRFDTLEQKLERTPTYSEMIDEYPELEGDEVCFFLETNGSSIVSLDASFSDEDNLTPFSDMIKDNDVVRTDHLVLDEDIKLNITKMLSLLKNDNEREVLKLIYGLNGGEMLTLKRVGAELSLTSERVRQIRDTALLRLKTILTAKIN